MKNSSKNNYSRKNSNQPKKNHTSNNNSNFYSKNTNSSNKNNRTLITSSKGKRVKRINENNKNNFSSSKRRNPLNINNINVSYNTNDINQDSQTKRNFDDWIWGKHSVYEALISERAINRIWCTSEIYSSEKFYWKK